jgi:hypothetical protein
MVNAPFAGTPLRLTYGGGLILKAKCLARSSQNGRGAPAAGSKRIDKMIKAGGRRPLSNCQIVRLSKENI